MFIQRDIRKIPQGIWRHFQQSIKDYPKTYGYPLPLSSLEKIKKWNDLQIPVPSGKWWVHLGEFKLCGNGPYPSTILPPGSASEGQQLPSHPSDKFGRLVEKWLG